MIGKAPGKLPDDPGGLLDPLEQDDAGIRADRPPVEPSNQSTSILCLQDDGLGCTLCRHQKAPSFCCQLLLDKRLIADKGAFFNTICEKCGLSGPKKQVPDVGGGPGDVFDDQKQQRQSSD